MLKTVVLAPMPRARDKTAAAVNPGFFPNDLKAKRRSLNRPCMPGYRSMRLRAHELGRYSAFLRSQPCYQKLCARGSAFRQKRERERMVTATTYITRSL